MIPMMFDGALMPEYKSETSVFPTVSHAIRITLVAELIKSRASSPLEVCWMSMLGIYSKVLVLKI